MPLLFSKPGNKILILIINSIVLATAIDISSHQFTLWKGNNATLLQNNNHQTTATLPASYDNTYQRAIALAGLNFHISNIAEFRIFLEPYASTPTTQLITLASGANTYFYQLSIFIVFVVQGSSWLSLYNATHTCTSLQSVASGATQQFTIGGPSGIVTVSEFEAFSWLSFYHSWSSNNVQLGCGVLVISIAAPDQYTLQLQKYATTVLEEVGYMMLVVKKADLVANLATRYQVYFDRNQNSLLNSTPTSFNIPSLYSTSPFGGFDGYCIIGIIKMYLAGKSGTLYDRSVMFDAHTDPFSDTENMIYYNGATPEMFYTLWNSVCISNCPQGYYYVNTVCFTCLTNCKTCTHGSICIECFSGYGLAANSMSCIDCVTLTTTCSDCVNSTYCLACVNDTYGISASNMCLTCSTVISNCLQCNFSDCLMCSTNEYALEWDGSVCTHCSVYLPNCLACADNSTCLSCLGGYYLGNDSLCHLCSSSLPNCIECSYATPVSLECTTCQDTFFLTPSFTCLSCSSAIPNCLNCTNDTYCSECLNASFIFSTVSGTCDVCSQLYPYCLECNSSQCLSCPYSTILSDNGQSCVCVFGYLINGICLNVFGCTQIMRTYDGTYECVQCDTTLFDQRPVNGKCSCTNGTLTNELCSDLSGCITPFETNVGIQCLYCNVEDHFQSQPHSNGSCLCQNKYFLQGGTCLDICGDGFLMNQTTGVCDDGNLENGDGCSSSCQIEVGYRCSGGTEQRPSVCIYPGILTLSLYYIERRQGLNQGLFRFTIEPALSNINKMNFSQHLSFNCESNYTVSNISYSDGILDIVADYTSDMQDRGCAMTLSFDPTIVIGPTSSLSFTVQSRNSPLVISQYIQQYATIKFIFEILSYIILSIFLLSLPHKMMGAELLFNCQLIYLSNALYKDGSFLFSSVLQFVNVAGKWSFYYSEETDQNMIYPFTDRTHITSSFLDNSMFIVGALSLLVLSLIMVKIVKLLGTSDQQQRNPSLESKITFFETVIHNNGLFPITMSFIFVLLLSAYISNLTLQRQLSPFPIWLNSIVLCYAFAVAALTITSEIFAKNKEQGMRPWHIPVFLARVLIVTLLIEIGISSSYDMLIYIIFATQLFYFIFALFFRPYKHILHQLGMLFNQCGSIYAIALAILQRHVILAQAYELFLLFILEGIISLMSLFSVVRLIVTYRNVVRKWIDDPSVKPDVMVQQEHREKLLQEQAVTHTKINQDSIAYSKGVEHSQVPKQLAFASLYNELKRKQVKTNKNEEQLELIELKKKLRKDFRKQLLQEKERREQKSS